MLQLQQSLKRGPYTTFTLEQKDEIDREASRATMRNFGRGNQDPWSQNLFP